MRLRAMPGADEIIFVRMILGFLCCAMVAPSWAGPPQISAVARSSSAEMDRVVHALCKKQVVLLGEDAAHASAATITVKVGLVKRLVQECGFRGVVFESQFYDMLDFEHAVAAKSTTRTQLADAIGALWSRYPAYAVDNAGPLRFIDYAQLKAMGNISARALSYRKPHTLDWSQLLDGIIVLREENAAVAKP